MTEETKMTDQQYSHVSKYDRATLGIDGNCGYALLGPDLQVGESEFEEIVSEWPVNSSPWDADAGRAITRCFRRLEARLGRRLTYYLDRSHPRNVG